MDSFWSSIAITGCSAFAIDHDWLGQSLYLREICGREDGAPPPVDLAHERRAGDLVRGLIASGEVTVCHDVSDGGLLVAIAEMAMAGNHGVSLTIARPGTANLHAKLFGESQGRYVLAVPPSRLTALVQRAGRAGVLARVIGTTGGDRLTVGEGQSISLASLRELNQSWLPNYMADAAEAP